MNEEIKNAQEIIRKSEGGKDILNGKEYSTVALRVEVFRKLLKGENLEPLPNVYTYVKILKDRVISKTYCAKKIDVVIGADGSESVHIEEVKASGIAEEIRDSSKVNKTSAVENAETSSFGRMLANLGLHGGNYASFDEVKIAINQQEKGKVLNFEPPKNPNTVMTNHIDIENQRLADDLLERVKKECKNVSQLKKWYLDNVKSFEDIKVKDLSIWHKLCKDLEEYKLKLPTNKKGK
jgi:hypothetical protein